MKVRFAIPVGGLAALTYLFLLPPAVPGQQLPVTELDQRIAPAEARTYRDLVKLALPDLTEDGKVGHTRQVRDGWLMNEVSTYEGALELTAFRGDWVDTPQGLRVVLFLQLEGDAKPSIVWGQLSLLAVIQVAPDPKLLDLVDVGGDRTTSYGGALALGSRISALVIAYEHHNAGENYRHQVFLRLYEDQVASLFNGFPYLYYGRSTGREIAEEGDFRARAGTDRRHRELVFDTTTVVTRYRADDETVRSKRTFRFRLRAVWLRGRYRFADGGAELRRMMGERRRAGFG